MKTKILVISNTNFGGAAVGLANMAKLLEGHYELHWLSLDGLKELEMPDWIFEKDTFSTEWASEHGLVPCQSVDAIPDDAILYEDNLHSVWVSPRNRDILRRFKRRLTKNHLFIVPPEWSVESSAFVKNYLCNFLSPGTRSLLEEHYGFKNLRGIPPYYPFEKLMAATSTKRNKQVDLLTSFRPNSRKISPELKHELWTLTEWVGGLKKVIISSGNEGEDAYSTSHDGYLRWMRETVRGYLHYQDNWVETFGSSLYEAIKLCDFVIYKPEPYCDEMIRLLGDSDKDKIIEVRSLSDYVKAILELKKRKQDGVSPELEMDFYNDKAVLGDIMAAFLETLCY